MSEVMSPIVFFAIFSKITLDSDLPDSFKIDESDGNLLKVLDSVNERSQTAAANSNYMNEKLERTNVTK